MPYINVKTTASITKENKVNLKDRLGKAIAIIPGKSEGTLMIGFEGERDMYFKGDGSKPCAFVEVMVLGHSEKKYYSEFAAAVTEMVNGELGIDPSRVYVKFEETDYWACGGTLY